jgi:hypothetical protein
MPSLATQAIGSGNVDIAVFQYGWNHARGRRAKRCGIGEAAFIDEALAER